MGLNRKTEKLSGGGKGTGRNGVKEGLSDGRTERVSGGATS